jgi:hypothetical protein
MLELLKVPEPKSGCIVTDPPMKLMSADEFGSTADADMSLFHRLSAGNGRKPFKLPPWPGVITLHALGGGGGGGALDVTCTFVEFEVLLPGFGLLTVIANVPGAAALPVTVSFVAELKVVLSAVPPNSTCAPVTNPLPLTVKVNAPIANVWGLTLLITGLGFQSVRSLISAALESAALTALIAALPELSILAGAVYKPEVLIVPTVALPPAMPLTNQFTA